MPDDVQPDPTTDAPQAPAKPPKLEQQPLHPWVALKDAVRGREIDFYPQFSDGDQTKVLPTGEVMGAFGKAAALWPDLPSEGLDDAIKLARQSLDEVKDQTEYQDQKATRLLTVTTFLTALSGALFTRMNDAYPMNSLFDRPWWSIPFLLLSYLLFSAFLLTSLCGALITFHATRTRFKYAADSETARKQGPAKSRLFYRGIVGVHPTTWAEGFVDAESGKFRKPALRPDLKQLYLRDLVGETYLIAAKTADKLRYLDPAQRLLALSLSLLLAWLIALPIVGVIVPAASPKPTTVDVVSMPQPTPTTTASPSPTPSPTATVTPVATPTIKVGTPTTAPAGNAVPNAPPTGRSTPAAVSTPAAPPTDRSTPPATSTPKAGKL